nr:two-component system sensor kinase [Kibdelosporangium sp. MJ126-NF4]CTQ90998.1 two-component system sensor kinase [Kibdelosporangium sp. MJ126-NF4]
MGEQLERRWNMAWALAPYGVLVAACVVSLTGDKASGITLAVAVGLGVWHWWFIVAHPQWWERNTVAMVGYFGGLQAFTVVLVLSSQSFLLFAPMCYILAFVALPGWLAFVGVVTANIPWLVVPGPDVLSMVVITAMAALVGWAIRTMEREAIRRRETTSRLVAVAAENEKLHAMLLERAREAGVAEERARMAREIHDTVAQGLTGIVTQLEAVDDLVSAGVRARIDTARQLARTSLVEVRRSIDALRPGPLRDTRLSEAVEQAVTTWRAQYDIPVTVTVTGTPQPMHSEAEVTVLRAAQEALSNVGRHAQAHRVDVTLSYMEDVVVLDVRDDGTGFDPRCATGFGLTALRQRVRLLAGSVEVESTPGGGTAVSVAVPLIEVDA